MDALFQTQSNELSTTTQKEKLFKGGVLISEKELRKLIIN